MATSVKPVEMVLISDNDLLGENEQAIGFQVLRLLQKESKTAITIKHVIATHSRAFQMVKKPLNYCMFNLIKTPQREAFLLFTKRPISIYPPIRLITLSNSPLTNPFSFEQLTGNENLKIGAIKGHSYGAFLDKNLLKNQGYLYFSGQRNSTQRLTGMLIKRRIEGFLEYTSSVKGFENVAGITKGVKLRSLEIVGNKKPAMGYLACSNSKEGKQIIDVMNKAFNLPQIEAQYIELHQLYFGHQEHALLSATFEQLFVQDEISLIK